MAAPNYSLQIKFETPGLEELENRIPSVMQRIRAEIANVNGELSNFSSSMSGATRSASTLGTGLGSLSQKTTAYAQSINAVISQINQASQGSQAFASSFSNVTNVIGQSSSGFRQFSSTATSSMQEARYAAQLFGREVGVAIPRALSSVAAQLPGIQTALSAAFPVIGAIAFGEVLAQLIEKLIEWKSGLKDIQEFNETIGKTLEEQAQKRQQLNKETQDAQLRLIGATRGPAAEQAARGGLLSTAVNTDKKNLQELEAQLISAQKRIADASKPIPTRTVQDLSGTSTIVFDPTASSRQAAELKDAQHQLSQINASLSVARAQYTRDNTERAAARAEKLKDRQREQRPAENAERRGQAYVEALEDREIARQYPAAGFGQLGNLQAEQRRSLQRLMEDPHLPKNVRDSLLQRTRECLITAIWCWKRAAWGLC